MFYWLISHTIDGVLAFLSIGPKHNTAQEAKEWLRENATTEGDYALVCLTVIAKPRVVVELEGLDDDDDGTRKRRKRATVDAAPEPAPVPVAPAVGTVAPPVRPRLVAVPEPAVTSRSLEPLASAVAASIKDALLQSGNHLTDGQVLRHIATKFATNGLDMHAIVDSVIQSGELERAGIEWVEVGETQICRFKRPAAAAVEVETDPQTDPEPEPEPETTPDDGDPADIGPELLANVMRAPEPPTVLQNGTTVEAFNGVDWRFCKYATQGTADKVANKVRAAIESGNPDAYATATSTFQPGRAPVEK